MGSLSSTETEVDTQPEQSQTAFVEEQQQQQTLQQQTLQFMEPLQVQQQQLPVQQQQQQQQCHQQMPVRQAPQGYRNRASRLSNSSMNFNPIDLATQDFHDDDAIAEAESVPAAAAAAQPEPDPTSAADAVLSLSTRIEYTSLARGQTQDVFGLVTVQGAAAPAPPANSTACEEERQAMDLVCVLDVSGSMRGDKIKQVQDAMRFVIDQADPKDRLSIVAFNSNAQRVLRLRKMDTEGKDNATVATLQLNAGGGTSIAAGLSMGLQVMEQRRQRNKVSSILLLTDGQDGSTRHQLPGLISRAQQANCSVYAFGFGRDHDEDLLSELAEQAQTPFTSVENTDKIREAFAGAVGGLTSIIAQGVELTISGQVTLKNVHTPFTIRRISETSAAVTIPDVFAGERRDILVELAVPASGDSQTTLLQAHLRYTDLKTGCLVQTTPVVMEAQRVEEPDMEAEPDEEVSAQRDRIEVTQALQQASAQSDLGQFSEAQQVIEQADQRMKKKRAKTAMSKALCSELQDAKCRMQSQIEWESGGRAEIRDAMQMHKMQRATNLMQSSSSFSKSSKQMYCNTTQASWVQRSKTSG
jgi:Mg-chelatase subunit ChlD